MKTKYERIFIRDVNKHNYPGICKLFAKYGINRFEGSKRILPYLEAYKWRLNLDAYKRDKGLDKNTLYGAMTDWNYTKSTLYVKAEDLDEIIDWLDSDFEFEFEVAAGQVYEVVMDKTKYRLFSDPLPCDHFTAVAVNEYILLEKYSKTEIESFIKYGYWKLVSEN